jgi:hypothetical protein
MKLYQTTGEIDAQSSKVIWNTSSSNASKDRTTMKKDALNFVNTVEIDIPTNKTELLAFLNKHEVIVK